MCSGFALAARTTRLQPQPLWQRQVVASVAAGCSHICNWKLRWHLQLRSAVGLAANLQQQAAVSSATAAAAAAAAAAQHWRRWWKWAHSLGFETQQSNVAAAESSRGSRVRGSAAAEALATAAQRSSVGGNGSRRRCSAGIGGSGSAAQPLAAAVQRSHWRSAEQRCRRQRQWQLRRRHWWHMKNLCIRQKVNPFNYK